VFLGTVDEAVALLEEGGMLQDLNKAYKLSPDVTDAHAKYPYGVRLKAIDSVHDFYLEVGPRSTPSRSSWSHL
jgi:hypothetical protein